MSHDIRLDRLRFFFVLLVVLIHCHHIGLINDADPKGFVFYDICDKFLTEILPMAAVAGLFLTSGYLFFANMTEWNPEKYKMKIHSRVHTLVIPYIIWNLAKASFLVVAAIWEHGIQGISEVFREYNGWHILWDGNRIIDTPVLMVTWYLRDLMVFCILAPCLLYAIKYLKVIPLGALMLCDLTGFWPTTHVCSAQNLFFFTLGSTLAINKWELFPSDSKWQRMSVIVTVSLLICSQCIELELIRYMTILSMIASFTYIARIANFVPQKLADSSTFIYLGHGLLFLTIIRFVIGRCLPFEGELWAVFRLITIPATTITLLFVIYNWLRTYCNSFTKALLGR